MIPLDNNSFLKEEYFDKYKQTGILDETYITLLEKELINYTNIKYIKCLCNATSGLYLGILSLDLKPNDEIIIPSYGYPSILEVSNHLQLNIKYCDINKNTLCLDPDCLESVISDNTKVVCYIEHNGCFTNEIFKVRDICNKYNCYLIEDAASGITQMCNGQMAGSVGDFAIYSFSGKKLIRGSEGGCLLTNNQDIYNKVNKLSSHSGIGNYKMSPMIAELIYMQIKDIYEIKEKRNRLHILYKKYLPIMSFDNLDSTCCVAYLSNKANNISTTKLFKNYFHRFPKLCDMNNVNEIYEKYIELPRSFNLTEQEIKIICGEIKIKEKFK